jgi:integrase
MVEPAGFEINSFDFTGVTRVVSKKRLTNNRMSHVAALRMFKRQAAKAGLTESISCHTPRATGIMAYLSNWGSLENAMRIAAHESARTTRLYDRKTEESNAIFWELGIQVTDRKANVY